jgi:class 3 adenylate cyclase
LSRSDNRREPYAQTGGTLIEYIGDAVLACWNNLPGQQAIAEHGFCALLAGWRMRQRLQQLAPEWRRLGYPPIHLRTGASYFFLSFLLCVAVLQL